MQYQRCQRGADAGDASRTMAAAGDDSVCADAGDGADGPLCAAGGQAERLLPSGWWQPRDRDHLEVTATGALLYRCPACRKAVSWSSRSHHKAFHEGRTFCPRCGRRLSSLKSLNKHLELCGIRVKPAKTGGSESSLRILPPSPPLALPPPPQHAVQSGDGWRTV